MAKRCWFDFDTVGFSYDVRGRSEEHARDVPVEWLEHDGIVVRKRSTRSFVCRPVFF